MDTVSAVKMENGLSSKQELGLGFSTPPMADSDYEDTGELEMSQDMPNGWLVRIPKILYESWAGIAEDEEIQLGIVRHYTNGEKFQIRLDPQIKQNQKVPKEYDMRLTNPALKNTFIFSEKDKANYKGKVKNGTGAGLGTDRTRSPSAVGAGVDKFKRYQPWHKKGVPKQTMLCATATSEATCTMVDNEESRRLMKEREDMIAGSKPQMVFRNDDVRLFGGMMLPRANGAPRVNTDGWDNMVSTARPLGKPKRDQDKFTRMPENELLDALFECFDRFTHWPLNSLRVELKQPEQHLRDNLLKIAELVQSGDFARTWKLKAENQKRYINSNVKQEAAPENEAELDDDDNDGDDDDGMGMEDVPVFNEATNHQYDE